MRLVAVRDGWQMRFMDLLRANVHVLMCACVRSASDDAVLSKAASNIQFCHAEVLEHGARVQTFVRRVGNDNRRDQSIARAA